MASSQTYETSTREIICARVDNMMSLSEEVISQNRSMYELLTRHENFATMRRSVVKWMKYVSQSSATGCNSCLQVESKSFLYNLSRDTSIQLFDRYFGSKVAQEKDTLYALEETMAATVAVVAVVTSSKIHEFRPISTVLMLPLMCI